MAVQYILCQILLVTCIYLLTLLTYIYENCCSELFFMKLYSFCVPTKLYVYYEQTYHRNKVYILRLFCENRSPFFGNPQKCVFEYNSTLIYRFNFRPFDIWGHKLNLMWVQRLKMNDFMFWKSWSDLSQRSKWPDLDQRSWWCIGQRWYK